MDADQHLEMYHTIRNLWVRCKASEDGRFVDDAGDCFTLETVISFRGESHNLDEWAVILGFAGHVTVPVDRKGDVAGYYGYSMSGVTTGRTQTAVPNHSNPPRSDNEPRRMTAERRAVLMNLSVPTLVDSTTGEPISFTANGGTNSADTTADGNTPHISFKSVSSGGPRNRHERRRAAKLGLGRKGNPK